MLTRRGLLLAGAGVSVANAAEFTDASRSCGSVSLDGPWQFRLDRPDAAWREVTVPHTWQIEAENADYRGTALYKRAFHAPREWAGHSVRIEFEAVFHTAVVSVNGKEAGRHERKGYTAFALEIGRLLRLGAENTVEVKVDNAFDDAMLPRGRSSDWAHDGGVYRPVRLLVAPEVYIERVAIDAEPDLAAGSASVAVTAMVVNASAKQWSGSVSFSLGEEAAARAEVRVGAGEKKAVALGPAWIERAKLWSLDRPHLYQLRAELSSGHAIEDAFGVRKIEIREGAFYLNGEKVRLMGVERMAGSNPVYGMAEPESWIRHDMEDMRNLNCVFTRVHWPQDRRVLDWCDRNGVLIQTEVPGWGSATFQGMGAEPAAALVANGREQLAEMIARDRNHPCIFSWGVSNEIGGQNPAAYEFARRMVAVAKRLDPKRMVSYASHSLSTTPERDATGLMDFVMWNEYIGSWQPGGPADLARVVDQIHRAFPLKPVVISEYGYCACTPDRPEGDEPRIRIMIEHDRVFRERDWIAGLVFFCYNDYRTHVGDRGRGALQQRVHGVVDLYGARKPSYEKLREESSPVESLEVSGSPANLKIQLRTRETVPAYPLRGYRVRAVAYSAGDIPVECQERSLWAMDPGEEATVEVQLTEAMRVTVDVLRPDGTSVRTAVWRA